MAGRVQADAADQRGLGEVGLGQQQGVASGHRLQGGRQGTAHRADFA
ncbi:MAG: hypothetical protein Q8Q73_03915 [Stagnimonas sp.]|nr:hypothetical protein [Stagnimonas sp.]